MNNSGNFSLLLSVDFCGDPYPIVATWQVGFLPTCQVERRKIHDFRFSPG